jgi:anti-anti-sigma regulatory factor
MVDFNYDYITMRGTITHDGRLTVENLAVLKRSLLEALAKTDHLIVDHTGADEFDFAYIILLLSIIKMSEQLDKKFTLVNGRSENMRKLLIKSGFADIKIFSNIFLN